MLRILILSLCLSCAVSTESFAGSEEVAAAVVVGAGTAGAAVAHFGFGAGALTSLLIGGVTGVGTFGAGAACIFYAMIKAFH